MKRRLRTGYWPCKAKKVKCGEEKPIYSKCKKNGVKCDYSVRLNWNGHPKKSKISGIQSISALSAKSKPSSGRAGIGPGRTTSGFRIFEQLPLLRPPSTFDQPNINSQALFFSSVPVGTTLTVTAIQMNNSLSPQGEEI